MELLLHWCGLLDSPESTSVSDGSLGLIYQPVDYGVCIRF